MSLLAMLPSVEGVYLSCRDAMMPRYSLHVLGEPTDSFLREAEWVAYIEGVLV